MKKDTRQRRPFEDSVAEIPRSARRSWTDFWFRPIDPRGMHVLRVLAGVLFVTWLLPVAGDLDAMFGLNGWFDEQAYREAARLPEEARPHIGWSFLFLCGANAILLKVAYALSLIVLVLFTLGVATRLTSVLTWIIVVAFTVNPATSYDADALLVMLAFSLMVGYLFLGLRRGDQSLGSRLMGGRAEWMLPCRASGTPPRSVAANVAVRLIQVHLAIVIVTSGLHKLQFGDWWAGVAMWYPLYPPLVATVRDAREHMANAIPLLAALSLAAYATLGWQIAFPLFAWKPAWRMLLLGGAIVGWLGNVFLYELPVFGAVMVVGCLSYLTPAEWQWIHEWLGKRPATAGAKES